MTSSGDSAAGASRTPSHHHAGGHDATVRPSEAVPAYAVPERSGEVLIDPPLGQIPAVLAAVRSAADAGAQILDTPLGLFRSQVRRRALSLAGPPTDGDAPGPAARAGTSAAAPMIAMGHQPLFFHPGVWMKFFLLSRLCDDLGATGLHLIVDSDASGPIGAQVPARDGRLIRRSETLVDLPEDVPLEACPPPSEEAWEGFRARVRGHLVTLSLPDLPERFDAFAEGAGRARARAGTLAMFMAAARGRYEAGALPPRYRDLSVSALSDTPEFRAFVLHLLQDPRAFRRCYNAKLEDYRRTHRLRSSANPFPNLDELAGVPETPFWVVHGGRRTGLYAAREGDRVRLRTAAGTIADLPAGAAGLAPLAASGLRIRPKAITLTMFTRLCMADLFIHGIGGGRYDRVTDAVIQEIFGCPPPPYVVATATLLLPLLGQGPSAEDARAVDRRLMDLQHNPERYLPAPTEAQRGLIEEKWRLIRGVEAMRPGPERRAATHRIRAVNSLLAASLAGEMQRLRERRAALEQDAATRDVTDDRGYPFFLFAPAAVRDLVGAPTGAT